MTFVKNVIQIRLNLIEPNSSNCCGKLRTQMLRQLSTEQFHKCFLIRTTTTDMPPHTHTCTSHASAPPQCLWGNRMWHLQSALCNPLDLSSCTGLSGVIQSVYSVPRLWRETHYSEYEWYDELRGLAGGRPGCTLSFSFSVALSQNMAPELGSWWAMTGSRWCGQIWPRSGVCHGSHSWRWMCKFCYSDTCHHWRNGSQSVCII